MQPEPARVQDLVLILAVGLLVGFPYLGQERNWAAREVRHALIVAEMAQSGDYLVPTLQGEEYIYKQTVMHAPAALLCRMTGTVSMAWARMPSAVAGLLGACALYGIGLAWYGRRAALLGALMLLGIPGYAILARTARPDMVFTAALALMGLGLVRGVAREAGWRSGAWFALAGGAAGLALLAKGPYGIFYVGLFSAGVLACSRVCRSEMRVPRVLELLALSASFLAIPLAWGVAVYLRDDGAYLRKVFAQYAPPSEHVRPVYEYLHRAAVLVLPWTFFLPWVWRDIFRKPPSPDSATSSHLRTWLRKVIREPAPALAAAVFVTLSLIPGKRDHYLGPWYPYAILTVAAMLAARWESVRWRRASTLLLALSLASIPLYTAVVQPYLLQETNPKRDFCLAVSAAVPEEGTVLCFQTLIAEIAWVAHCQGRGQTFRVQQVDESREPFAKQALGLLARGGPCYLVVRERDLVKTLHATQDLQGQIVLEQTIRNETKNKETKYQLYRLSQ